MAIWIKWTEEQEQAWNQWMAERPPAIREMVAKHNLRADRLYLKKSTGKRVTLASFYEDGTVRVNVLPEYNTDSIVVVPISVFGVSPDDLEECECPIEVVDGTTLADSEEGSEE